MEYHNHNWQVLGKDMRARTILFFLSVICLINLSCSKLFADNHGVFIGGEQCADAWRRIFTEGTPQTMLPINRAMAMRNDQSPYSTIKPARRTIPQSHAQTNLPAQKETDKADWQAKSAQDVQRRPARPNDGLAHLQYQYWAQWCKKDNLPHPHAPVSGN